ncbi:hypothetical protein ACQEVX_35545 [Streptomyces syringium]|uniref:hypothetical protein n=1 Tax=Streptomyces syringium TaxID=76729 RepID=UPI003D92CD92
MKNNGRQPLKVSEIRPDLINLRDGEKRAIVCADCGVWRAIRDRMVIAHRAVPHSGQPRHRRSGPDRAPRCPGSGQRIWFDLTSDQWQARYEKLVNRRQSVGMNPASRHSTRVKRLGVAPAPVVVPRRRAAEWAAVCPAVSEADTRRAQRPVGEALLDSPAVPLTTLHPKRPAR